MEQMDQLKLGKQMRQTQQPMQTQQMQQTQQPTKIQQMQQIQQPAKMQQMKLYNMIFPIWLMMFFPPVILLTLAGNFVMDTLVLIVCYFVFRSEIDLDCLTFYKKSILKVWIFGLLADIVGAILLFACMALQDFLGLSNEVIKGITYDPFSNVLAVIIIFISILISGLFILLFNHNFTFQRILKDELTRWKVAAFIAILTLPWTFLLPTKLFY